MQYCYCYYYYKYNNKEGQYATDIISPTISLALTAVEESTPPSEDRQRVAASQHIVSEVAH